MPLVNGIGNGIGFPKHRPVKNPPEELKSPAEYQPVAEGKDLPWQRVLRAVKSLFPKVKKSKTGNALIRFFTKAFPIFLAVSSLQAYFIFN